MSLTALIIDDEPLARQELVYLVQAAGEVEVVAQGSNGIEAVELIRSHKPDVVLMDLRLPGIGGVEAIMAIRKEFPDARVIVLTTFYMDEDIFRAIQSGAKSYLLKDTSEDELAGAIRAVHTGKEILSGKVAERLAARRRRADLSQLETEVLSLLTKGRSNKEISSSLFITEDTVKAHLKTLFTKLNVKDRTEAAINAIRQGIVHLE